MIEIPTIELTESASIFDNLGAAVKSEKPLSFEDLDQGYGYVLYRTKISGPAEATLKIKQLRDYAVVCVDGQRVAVLDRRHNQETAALKIAAPAARLDILVENGGRINYGGRLTDNRKGITESVMLAERELTGWEMYKLPFDDVSALRFKATPQSAAPSVHRGVFELSQRGRHVSGYARLGQGNCFCQRAQSGPLLAYWPAADSLSARSLAQERPQ